MSATMQPPPGAAQPIGNNVVQFPPQGGAPPPGAAPMAGGPMPGMVPNPAFAAWMKQAQQVQAIMQANAKKQQQFDAACALIRKDGIHGFRLDIEADSTIAPDEQAEKAARVEFLQQMIPMLGQVVPMAQGNPPLASLGKEMTLFAARGFRVARPLEEALEQAWDAIAGMPPMPPKGAGQAGAQHNPQVEQAKIAADVHDTQMRAQADVQTTQLKAQTDQMAIQQKAQQGQQQMQIAAAKLQAENERAQATMALQAAELQQRERLEQARMVALQSRAAKGLT